MLERELRELAAREGAPAALLELRRRRAAGRDAGRQLEIELLLDAGDYEEGLSLARQLHAERPQEPEAIALLADALELSCLYGEALRLLEEAPADLGFSQRIHQLRQVVNPAAELSLEMVEAAALPAPAAGPEHERLARHLLYLFQGHPGAHARQVPMGSSREFGYVPVRRPMTPAEVSRHLAGQETLGVYFLDGAGRTCLACWDLDVSARTVTAARSDPALRAHAAAAAREEARRFLDLAGARGLSVQLERSGRKGYHFWLFLEPSPAAHIRLLGRWMLERLGSPAPPLSWEFFPKHDTPGPRGLGNLVKLPMGIHRATGKPSLFLDLVTLDPVPDQAAHVLGLRRMPPVELARLLGESELDRVARVAPRRYARRSVSTGDEGEEPVVPDEVEGPGSAGGTGQVNPAPVGEGCAIRIPLPASLDGLPALLVGGCGVVRALVEKARRGEALSARERHVLFYAAAPLGDEGRLFAHQVSAQARGYDPDEVSRKLRAVGPTLIGCKRIGERVPHLATRSVCRCRFELASNGYPSPLIYAGLSPLAEEMLPRGVAQDQAVGLEELLAHRVASERSPETLQRLEEAIEERRRMLLAELGTAPTRPPGPRLRLVKPERSPESEESPQSPPGQGSKESS